MTPELDTEGVEDAPRTFDRNAVVLVSFVTRYLGLVHTKLFGQLALGQAECDAQCDERATKAVKIDEFAEITPA